MKIVTISFFMVIEKVIKILFSKEKKKREESQE